MPPSPSKGRMPLLLPEAVANARPIDSTAIPERPVK